MTTLGQSRARAWACLPAVFALLGACSGGSPGDALALLGVSYDTATPTFDQIWFSVEGQPAVPVRKVPRATREAFAFGYFIPGLRGMYTVKAEARAGNDCLVGQGSAAPVLTPGQTSTQVPLIIQPVPNRNCGPPAAQAGGQVFDGPGPDELEAQSAGDTLAVRWTGFGRDLSYEHKIAPTADCEGTPLSPVSKVGSGSSYTAFNLMLPTARVYNCIRSLDASGKASRWVGSNGVTIDRQTPTVVEFRPAAGVTEVKRNEPLLVVFSEPVDPQSLADQVQLTAAGSPVAVKLALNDEGTTLSVRPETALPMRVAMKLTVRSGVRDRAGNPLAVAASADFTTADGAWSAPLELFAFDPSTEIAAGPPGLALATSSGGQATVVWEQVLSRTGPAPVFALVARRFDGTTWGTPHVISRSTLGRVDQPSVAMDPRGSTVFLFREPLEGGGVAAFGSAFDQLRGWDRRRGPFEQTPAGVEITSPVIKMGKSGLAIAAWVWAEKYDPMPPGGISPAFLPRISTTRHDGVDFQVAQQIGTPATPVHVDKGFPAVAVDPDGKAHAIWRESGPEGQRIVASRFSTSGWGPGRAISTSPDSFVAPFLDLAADGQGNATAVWIQNIANEVGVVFAAHLDQATDKWTAPAVGSSTASFAVQLASNEAGQTVATWIKPPGEMAVRRLSRGVWAPVTRTSEAYGPVRVGIDDRGEALVMWLNANRDNPAARILVARESASNGLAPPLQLNQAAGDRYELSVLPDGRAFAVWTEGKPQRLLVARFE